MRNNINWNNREQVLAAVRQNGLALQLAPENLKADREVVMAAVQQDGLALQFAPENLKADREVVMAAMRTNGYALNCASLEFQYDKEVVLAAVQQNGGALQYLHQFQVVQQNGGALQYLHQFQGDKDVILAAVRQNGYALSCASLELQNDKEVVLAAVQQNGRALEYASEDLRNDREVVMAAVQKEILNILNKKFRISFEIKSVARLSKPERRNLILRIILQSPSSNTPQSLIFKQSLHEKNSDDEKELLGRFARDWAGLEFLSGLNIEPSITPSFYGGSEKHRFVLLEDLGAVHFSLVDSLTGKDRKAAIGALTRYIQRMGQLHTSAYRKTDEYNKILQKLNPGAKVWQDSFDELLLKTKATLKKIGIASTLELDKELLHVFNTMKESLNFTTYIHGDICPDNVFDDPRNDTMHVIDFEWGFVGSALLDATYLRMSMPTCWCVKALPDDVIEPLEIIYRQELAKNIPAALDDNLYNESYVCACAYWTVILLAYGVNDVLDQERDILNTEFKDPHPNWKIEYNVARPRYLHRLQAFIDISSKHKQLPKLRNISEVIIKSLKIRWPDTKPLELFPPFV